MEEQLIGKTDEMSKEILSEVLEVFELAVNNKQSVHKVVNNEGQSTEHIEYVDREQHLENTIEWAMHKIGGSIETDNFGGNE